jgi:hypothetical protein
MALSLGFADNPSNSIICDSPSIAAHFPQLLISLSSQGFTSAPLRTSRFAIPHFVSSMTRLLFERRQSTDFKSLAHLIRELRRDPNLSWIDAIALEELGSVAADFGMKRARWEHRARVSLASAERGIASSIRGVFG